jgi:hypothetical protein
MRSPGKIFVVFIGTQYSAEWGTVQIMCMEGVHIALVIRALSQLSQLSQL